MTAINVLLLPDAVHVVSDTAQQDEADLTRVVAFGAKVFWLPALDAVLALSGRVALAHRLLAEIERGAPPLPDALNWLVDRARGLGGNWSLVLAGPGTGIGINSSGTSHPLGPGNVVKSLLTPETFDPADIAGSGLRIVADQKARHGVVGGQIVHSVLTCGRFDQTVIGEVS